MASEVAFDQFSFAYPSAPRNAVSDISFRLPAGSCCALLGPTGAGKSTLLHALSGTLGKYYAGKATGSIAIGTDHHHPLPLKVLFPNVGLVLQEPHVQISGLHETVFDEIAFTLKNIGVSFEEEPPRVQEIASELGLESLLQRDPSTLSGGELQRVALASILVAKPEVLLLDEPVVSLDAESRTALTRLLRSISKQTTVIWAETQIDDLLFAADTFVVLNDGAMIFHGTRSDFVKKLDEVSQFLPVHEWVSLLHRIGTNPVRHSKLGRRLQRLLLS